MSQDVGTEESPTSRNIIILGDGTTTALLPKLASSSSKRACEENSSPISKKKAKETDTVEVAGNGNKTDAGDTSNQCIAAVKGPPREINQPTNNDFLLGLGRVRDFGKYNHPGNGKYCALVNSKKALYQAAASETAKSTISMDIIREWKSQQEPPGRFLKRHKEGISELWYTANDDAVNRKTIQMLCKGLHDADRFLQLESAGVPYAKQGEEQVQSAVTAGAQLRNIRYDTTTENDVLISSISLINNRGGNLKYSGLIGRKRGLYEKSRKKEGGPKRGKKDTLKASMANAILREWRLQDPPGRFLKPDMAKSMIWNDIGDEAATKKISVALGRGLMKERSFSNNGRGGAIRKNIESDGVLMSMNFGNGDMKPVSSLNESKHQKSDSNREPVCPHGVDSPFHDVLAYFTSTPFNAESMSYLREQKERNITRECLILPSRAYLPILPQKQFLNSRVFAQGPVRKPPPSVMRDVALMRTSLLAKKKGNQPLQHSTSPSLPQCAVSKIRPKANSKSVEQLEWSVHPVSRKKGQRPIVERGNGAQLLSHNTSLPVNAKLLEQLERAVVPASKKRQSPITKSVRVHADAVSGISHSSTLSLVLANQPQVNEPPSVSQTASGKKFKESERNDQTTAKIPAASGSNLNDKAEHFAQAATVIRKDKAIKSANSKKVSLVVSIDATPKNGTSTSSTPKTPRTPAVLLTTKPTPNFPVGWISKTYQRKSGYTAGLMDTYYYSPNNQVKFRTLKGCRQFIQILEEPDIDGDEFRARRIYKGRGHKF